MTWTNGRLFLSSIAVALSAQVGCGEAGSDPAGDAGPPDAGAPDAGRPLPPIEWTRLAGDGAIEVVDISDDGARVAFTSAAPDLVAGDQNGSADAFVLDTGTGAVLRASLSSAGEEADCGHMPNAAAAGPCSYAAALSGDGQTVIFASRAPDLVPGDQNGVFDLFARDLAGQATERVNLASDGTESDYEYWPSAAASADGNLVAFYSLSATFVPEPGCAGVYLRDRAAGTTTQVSLTWEGGTDTGCITWETGGVSLSASGQVVAFGFRNGFLVPEVPDEYLSVFSRDMSSLSSQLASAGADGVPADDFSDGVDLSADGRHAVFWSRAGNLVAGDDNGAADVYLRDRQTGAIERLSLSREGAASPGDCGEPSISGDGRFVAFACEQGGLVAGDAGLASVYVRDRATGAVALVSQPPGGGAADGDSSHPVISADGRAIAFSSEAANLHGGDGDRQADLFVAPNPLLAD